MPILYILLIIIACLLLLFTGIYLFTKSVKFGSLPTGKRLERIKKSPNYINGQFINKEHTPSFTGRANIFKVLWEVQFKSGKTRRPVAPIPGIKTNIRNLPIGEDVLIWFGHSSYYFQLNGKKFLVDPVFNNAASPLSFTTQAFEGTNFYGADEMPSIDFLILTHDHWDHLDYKTLLKLKPKVNKVICPLGVGAHLQRWEYNENLITEMDWDETYRLDGNHTIHSVTSRHFSGRGLKRNQSLWSSYVLQTDDFKMFLGVDGGFGKHFKEIATRFAPFDFGVIENGQYNQYWKHSHCFPEETAKIIEMLQIDKTLPVHSAKFTLSTHKWDEPLAKLSALSGMHGFDLLTPKIGELIYLKKPNPDLTNWWESIS